MSLLRFSVLFLILAVLQMRLMVASDASTAATAPCTTDPATVQDPYWYRLRLAEVKKAKTELEDIYHAHESAPNQAVDKLLITKKLSSARSLLSNATWKYGTEIDSAFTKLTKGLSRCDNGNSQTCFNESVFKESYVSLRAVEKDMNRRLGSLAKCDPVVQIPKDERKIVDLTKQIADYDRQIRLLAFKLKNCQVPRALPDANFTTINTLLEAVPNAEYHPVDQTGTATNEAHTVEATALLPTASGQASALGSGKSVMKESVAPGSAPVVNLDQGRAPAANPLNTSPSADSDSFRYRGTLKTNFLPLQFLPAKRPADQPTSPASENQIVAVPAVANVPDANPAVTNTIATNPSAATSAVTNPELPNANQLPQSQVQQKNGNAFRRPPQTNALGEPIGNSQNTGAGNVPAAH